MTESAEKSKRDAGSPSKRSGPKYDEDRHPRSRSRTGERDKARDKDWDAKGMYWFLYSMLSGLDVILLSALSPFRNIKFFGVV